MTGMRHSTSTAGPRVPESPRTTRSPTVVIEPPRRLAALELREIWEFRDLLWILAGRDVRLRYRQTLLGVFWVVLQPLISAAIFAVVFGKFAKLPSDGHPYLLFAFGGLLPWNLFSGAIQRAGGSLVGSSTLISKVYFPRMVIPLASVLSVLVDFAVSLTVVLVCMFALRSWPSWRIATLPLWLALALVLSTGVGLWFSSLNVYYRDFMYALPFVVQVWLFASPVTYAYSIVPEKWRLWYCLNPLVALIEGFRWALLGGNSLTLAMVVTSAIGSLAILGSGAALFRSIERGFADAI